jgi:hypothetical protein
LPFQSRNFFRTCLNSRNFIHSQFRGEIRPMSYCEDKSLVHRKSRQLFTS